MERWAHDFNHRLSLRVNLKLIVQKNELTKLNNVVSVPLVSDIVADIMTLSKITREYKHYMVVYPVQEDLVLEVSHKYRQHIWHKKYLPCTTIW